MIFDNKNGLMLDEERQSVSNISAIYELPELKLLPIMHRSVYCGRMTFEDLEIALKEVRHTIKNKEEFELVCKFFERITLEGVNIECATEWWIKTMIPVRPPNTHNGLNAIRRIMKTIKGYKE